MIIIFFTGTMMELHKEQMEIRRQSVPQKICAVTIPCDLTVDWYLKICYGWILRIYLKTLRYVLWMKKVLLLYHFLADTKTQETQKCQCLTTSFPERLNKNG